MRVVVETPKWSFTKYGFADGAFKPEFSSPLPTLFNYGFQKGTKAADGQPQDAIILGPRLIQGAKVEVRKLGVVRFIDDGKVDDKLITSTAEGIGLLEKLKIHIFFEAYVVFKILLYLRREGRIARCRYGGFATSGG